MKRLFEENTICRLCLRVDENAFKVSNTNHKTFIESIVTLKKIQYVLPDNLYVCYICKVLLAKCFNFAQTVWKAQEIIFLLLKTTDIITKPMLDHIDRHNNGLNPITLCSVVTCGNKTEYNSGDDNVSGDDGNTSTGTEEVEGTDIEEVECTDIEEVESTDIEEIDLDVLVDKMKKNTKKQQEQERKKKKQKCKISKTENYLGPNSSSDENETVSCNLDEEEVEIGNIGKKTSDIFVDNLTEGACDKPRPTRTRQKPKRLEINEKITRTTKRFYPNEAKSASSTTNQKECKNKTDKIEEDYHHDSTSISTANENKRRKKYDEIDEDHHHDSTSISTANEKKRRKKSDEIDEEHYHDSTSISTANENKRRKKTDEIDEDHYHDSTSISTANENKRRKKTDEIDEDHYHDSTSISTANENKRRKKTDEIDEDHHHDSTSISTANENKRRKKTDEIDEDHHHDSTSISTANENKRKKKSNDIDKDYCPDSTSHSEDTEYDSYDDEGKPIRKPIDTRIYPMKCEHCDFVLLRKRDHYHHYLYVHPDIKYPYKNKDHVTCMVCGKLVRRGEIRPHEAIHFTTTKKFKCNLCPKVFPNGIKLSSHKTCVHPKKKVTCDYCSKEFKTKSDLERHIRIHTGIKPYKCHICDEAFAHSGNRQIHIRIRHQNYKYKPKKQDKTQKKRRKYSRYSTNKEVYDTSDDEPLINVAINPQRISKIPSEDSNGKTKKKCKKQEPIQNGIGESKAKS